MAKTRYPHYVYGKGTEPDPRFTLANERTFLAWIRTSLSLIATGVGLEYFGLPASGTLRGIAVAIFLLMGVYSSIRAALGWANTEIALRENRVLPGMGIASLLGLGIAIAAVVVVIGVFVK